MNVPCIVASGALTPAGLDALGSAFVARTQCLDPQPSSRDREGRPIGVHRVDAVDPELEGIERLLSLAIPALLQITWPGVLPLYLALPGDIDDALFLARLALVAPIDVEASRVARIGAHGGVWAFEAARSAAAAGQAVLVGGVDSLIAESTLARLDAEGLLGTSDRDGLTPSEAAAFALIRPAASGVCISDARYSENADVLRGAESSWLLTDLDGTPAKNDAFADLVVAAGGVRFLRRDDLVWLYGDVGAASVPLLAVHAACAHAADFAPADRSIVLLSADAAERRGAVVLEVVDA
ncbi:MAG TPA: hypothetical protein VFB62_18810 [Polyangiaceae bacterium]|nr:hypothetical protein [Polyangiaceae bacterium]